MKLCYLCVLSIVIVASFCGHATRMTQSEIVQSEAPLIIKKNDKYNLSCLFYGEKFTNDAHVQENAIKYVAVRDDASNEEVKYEPSDPATIESSRAFYTDVWSPNEEDLVLPLGRFKGFCIIKAAVALKSIKQHECADSVKVYASSDTNDVTGLWHDFQRWGGTETFLFKAGLSGDSQLFEYDISKGTLSGFKPQLNSAVGENSKGKLVIVKR